MIESAGAGVLGIGAPGRRIDAGGAFRLIRSQALDLRASAVGLRQAPVAIPPRRVGGGGVTQLHLKRAGRQARIGGRVGDVHERVAVREGVGEGEVKDRGLLDAAKTGQAGRGGRLGAQIARSPQAGGNEDSGAERTEEKSDATRHFGISWDF